MNWLTRLLGVSEGDVASLKKYNSSIVYLAMASYRSTLRLFANHCIIPSLRVALFRWSGVKIGRRVRVNLNTWFLDDFQPGLINLADEVSVAPNVSFVAASNPNDSMLQIEYNMGGVAPIYVKRGAWLGVGVVVMPGVTIGEAAIIGANAVVSKDVEDYSIMAGIPAQKIGDVRER